MQSGAGNYASPAFFVWLRTISHNKFYFYRKTYITQIHIFLYKLKGKYKIPCFPNSAKRGADISQT
jgi:hypothetical protein